MIKEAPRRRMHHNVEATAKWLGKVVNGWLNYYAVPTSFCYLRCFVARLERLWLRKLRRRSQKDRYKWVSVATPTARYWPKLEIRHPWPSQRFAVNSPQGKSLVP